MTGKIAVQAQSVEVWEEAKTAVLAIFMYVLTSKSVKIVENLVGCEASMSFNQAQRAFKLLLEQMRSNEFPVKVRLTAVLEGKRD